MAAPERTTRSFDGDDAVERVRAATDIVDLIGRYVPLRRAGGAFKGLCPFHQEKSPSFHVNPSRQIFKCFGCGEGGDVFSFVLKYEKSTFPEALRMLAERAGIELRPPSQAELRARDEKTEILRALDWAQRVFVKAAKAPDAEHCRAYADKRGVSEEMRELFGLGYAPSSGRFLVEAASRSGVPMELLDAAGLALKRDGGSRFDRFRNRWTFPIRDRQGRVVAFGARTLDGQEPKYLNSPETIVFKKGRTLYGLDLLRDHRRGEPILVMEGYTDVIAARQAGLNGAVATLGTAFTPSHASLLRSHADRVVLVYDGDAAGLAAAARAAPLLLEAGAATDVDLRVATLPGGEDPADFFGRRGAEGLKELEGFTVELTAFVLDRLRAGHDLDSLAGKRRAAEEAAALSARIDHPVSRAAFVERAAKALSIPQPTLAGLAKERRIAVERSRAASGGDAASTKRADDEPKRAALPVRGDLRQAYEWTLRALVNWTQTALKFRSRFRPELFAAAPAGRTIGLLFQAAAADPSAPTARLIAALDDPADRALAERYLDEEPEPERLESMLEDVFGLLEDAALVPEAERLMERSAFDDDDDALKRLSDLMTRDRLRRLKRGRE
jgi:DNA primase